MKKRKATPYILAAIAVILLAIILWIAWGNTALELNAYTVESAKIPEEFDGFRIAHISDLHNAQIGSSNERLLKTLKEAEPDIIAITGDLIDSRNTELAVALEFAEKALEIAPCYYVSGNHEARIAQYPQLRQGLVDLGVVVLENDSVQLQQNEATIRIAGVNDPSFQTDYLSDDSEAVMRASLEPLADAQFYTILLSHRPELFPVYEAYNMDLVLSGHAHGGQFRLPIIGGVFAPNQGFFPKYDAGMYKGGQTAMLVSRGIGNSILPFRINNQPEIILIELKHPS